MSDRPVRARLVGVTVQPQVFLDDGETLTPVAFTPEQVPASQLQRWVDSLPAALARLAEQQQPD